MTDPLYSEQLEHDVLSACLQGKLPSDAPFLRPEHFYLFPNQACWQALLDMQAAGAPTDDTVQLLERLRHTKTIEPDYDWNDYLMRLQSGVMQSSPLFNFDANALAVYDYWRRRNLIRDYETRAQRTADLSLALPPDEVTTPLARKTWTVADILSAEVPEPRGPWKGVIPPGLTLLGARPKSGKSVLMLQLATALGCGGMHFGQRVEQMRVLYYALEDKVGRLQKRMQMLGTPSDASIEVRWQLAPLYDGGLEEVLAAIEQYGLVIIDTIERAMPRKDFTKDGKDYADVLGRLQSKALEQNASVVAVVHRRKGQEQMRGDPIDDVLGSTQLTTTADCVLCIYPELKDGKRTKRSRLLGRARDLEDIELTMQFDGRTLCWQPVEVEEEEEQRDEQEEIRKNTEAQEAVLETVRRLGKATAKEISDDMGANSGSIWQRLDSLWKRGQLERAAHGKSFDYFLPNHNGHSENTNEQMEFNEETD